MKAAGDASLKNTWLKNTWESLWQHSWPFIKAHLTSAHLSTSLKVHRGPAAERPPSRYWAEQSHSWPNDRHVRLATDTDRGQVSTLAACSLWDQHHRKAVKEATRFHGAPGSGPALRPRRKLEPEGDMRRDHLSQKLTAATTMGISLRLYSK